MMPNPGRKGYQKGRCVGKSVHSGYVEQGMGNIRTAKILKAKTAKHNKI
jgi:hypothetical protein